MLELKNIVKDYVSGNNVTHALKGINISFRQNEFVSILGPSGCGKTTTLNIIGGLDRYTLGDLLIKGQSTKNYKDRDWDTYRNHSIGFVFQTYNLIPQMNILGNVELALTIGGIGKEERQARALEALEKVGLANEAKKRPNQLSGGQMQRVAIARALVNNPEILLADEPTGALDSVTSVQIMELLKEVAKDRLVIMVTHNPDLAYKYSTRIVTMKDGEIIDDSNPFVVEEKPEVVSAEEVEKVRKSKMNGKTTFLLSAKNLLAKAKRTTLVCIAGSIGIIGISAVLAVTSGVRNYIHDMQDDMLSGNPIQIKEQSLDLGSLISFASTAQKTDAVKKSIKDGKINIDYMIEYLADTRNKFEESLTKNDITADYFQYVKEMPEDYYSAMKFGYGNNRKLNMYTDWTYTNKSGEIYKDTTKKYVSLQEIEDIYVTIVKKTAFANYASMIPMFTSTFDVLPNDDSYVLSQYNVLNEGGYLPKADNEMAIIVDKDQRLTDLFLAQVGYYTQAEFAQVIDEFANGTEGEDPQTIHDRLQPQDFDYDKLLNKKYTVYPDNDVFYEIPFTPTLFPQPDFPFNPLKYGYHGEFKNDGSDLPKTGKDMKITAILKPKEGISYGCLDTGFVISKSFDEAFISANKESNIASYLRDVRNLFKDLSKSDEAALIEKYKDKENDIADNYPFLPADLRAALKAMLQSTTLISLSFYQYECDMTSLTFLPEEDQKVVGSFGTPISVGTIGENAMSIIQNLMGSFDLPSQLQSALRTVGGEEISNSINVYPKSFDEKDLVTSYLDKWNGDDTIVIHPDGVEKQVQRADRSNIKYSDNLEIVIRMINSLIDIISIALIAFTSLSLVVSTVMIGIITYVSVVERVKEIGIIRSLGGRKLDVSNLFIVETFIIGAISGLFGIGVTYLLSLIINIILKVVAGVGAIVILPWYLALAVLALSIVLTLISGLIPSRAAAKKDPVVALRSGE
ncbi:MAG: ABC transporter ATP-binding protein/permease [Bacilli bacterium]|nr:ABC transporter ATP-binding protein/permease [Bacilli bacterium]